MYLILSRMQLTPIIGSCFSEAHTNLLLVLLFLLHMIFQFMYSFFKYEDSKKDYRDSFFANVRNLYIIVTFTFYK